MGLRGDARRINQLRNKLAYWDNFIAVEQAKLDKYTKRRDELKAKLDELLKDAPTREDAPDLFA